MTQVPADDRSERMQYRRNGRSGPKLPPISLGPWQNFGGAAPLERSRAIPRRAFTSDAGDLAPERVPRRRAGRAEAVTVLCGHTDVRTTLAYYARLGRFGVGLRLLESVGAARDPGLLCSAAPGRARVFWRRARRGWRSAA